MADGRKRSAAKQARRDARRRKARRDDVSERETPEDTPLIDEVREALDTGQPLDLLGLVSLLILATSLQPGVLRPPDEDPPSLTELVAAFIDVQVPETTALLAVLGELVVGDDALRNQCRRAVASRHETLPGWLAALGQTSIHRVVRMTHVLGDGDEVLVGVRLADGTEMTCAASIDHLMTSEIRDAFFVPSSIDTVLGVAKAGNANPDNNFADVDLADARAELHDALDKHLSMLPLESDTWPGCRPLVQWLIQLMPGGGSNLWAAERDSTDTAPLLARFFASQAGMPFEDRNHRELLELCIEDGTGDPLRWSAARLRQLLTTAVTLDQHIAVESQLDVPELLRVFIPFAHAESGIRQELTAEALAVIDEEADGYRAEVLSEAQRTGDDDHGDDDDERV